MPKQEGRIMIRTLSLRTKLTISFCIIIAFLCASMFVGYYTISKMRTLIDGMYEENYKTSVGVAQLHAKLNGVRAALMTMLSETDRAKQEAQHNIIKDITKEIDASFVELINSSGTFREISVLKEARETWVSFRDTRDNEIIPAIYAGKTEKAAALAMGVQKERYNRFVALTKELIDMGTKAMEGTAGVSRKHYRALISSFVVIWLVSISASIAMALFLIRGIASPLKNIADSAKRIGEGDLDVRVVTGSRDEIGILAHAFNSMAFNLKKSFKEQERLYNEERRKVQQMVTLQEAVSAIASALELEPLLERLAYQAAFLLDAELSALVMLHPETGKVQHFKANIPPEAFPVKTMPEGRGLLGVVLKEGAMLHLDDATANSRYEGLPSGHPPLKALLGVPMLLKGKVIGGLFVANKQGGETFTQEDDDLLLMFALQTATAIENAMLYAKTVEMAEKDVLTGLMNRRVFHEQMATEFARASRYGGAFSLFMIDIDHFKDINDTYGHQAGDSVLQSLGRLLKEKTRNVDIVARYGGEEFAVILPETHEPSASLAGEMIRTSIAQTPFLLPDGKEIAITISVGVATHPRCGSTIEELIKCADQALYLAKQTGRNRVCVC
jgi:diguanylate cyclase (GGDEF)-like protein